MLAAVAALRHVAGNLWERQAGEAGHGGILAMAPRSFNRNIVLRHRNERLHEGGFELGRREIEEEGRPLTHGAFHGDAAFVALDNLPHDEEA